MKISFSSVRFASRTSRPEGPAYSPEKAPGTHLSCLCACRLVFLVLAVLSHRAIADSAGLSVQVDQPGVNISSNLFGIFFEEINSAGDGGIYAEMVRNRNFEEPGNTNYWQLVTTGTATGTMSADSSLPLSTSNLYSLQLTFSSGTGTFGAANNGWWEINFQAGQTYDLTLYARCSSA